MFKFIPANDVTDPKWTTHKHVFITELKKLMHNHITGSCQNKLKLYVLYQ